MAEYELQYRTNVHASTDSISIPFIAQQTNYQSPLQSSQSTYIQDQKVREKVARFDAVLVEILRQKEIAGEHVARQATARIQQGIVAEKTAEKTSNETEMHQTSATQDWSYPEVGPLCNHRVRWIDVPGRSRCEYHLYSKNAYINPFRSRCPACGTIACGLCRKKLKRGDKL